MSEIAGAWGVFDARNFAAALLLALAAFFLLGGALAQWRFPDFYTRLHAAAPIAGLGGMLLLAALAVTAWDVRFTARLALLAGAIVFTGPVVAHLLAAGAHGAGLASAIGRLKTKMRAR
ncbi:MAG: monovalent cation/H(+) antiporter subunit G [Hyphomonadaceae bacterium]